MDASSLLVAVAATRVTSGPTVWQLAGTTAEPVQETLSHNNPLSHNNRQGQAVP
jgi:hypothetical protein